MDEGKIADILDETLEAYPKLMLGSYPRVSGENYKVKLTLESRDSLYLEKASQLL